MGLRWGSPAHSQEVKDLSVSPYTHTYTSGCLSQAAASQPASLYPGSKELQFPDHLLHTNTYGPVSRVPSFSPNPKLIHKSLIYGASETQLVHTHTPPTPRPISALSEASAVVLKRSPQVRTGQGCPPSE